MTQSCQYRIDCEDSLLSNYSSEGAEPFPPYYAVVYPPITDIPLDQEWSMPGCLYICKSYISQEDANLCALRQAILCIDGPPGEEIWYSAPATCTATCPDGTIFYYTVPAGMFIAKTYAAALAQAQGYACLKAQEERFCIQDLPRCACAGATYSGTITTDVGRTGLTWTAVGALPPGLSLISTSTSATIAGTPILRGTYAFQIVATDANGNYAIKTFTIQVIEITTTVITPFTIGTPYSFQLTADGGSGNYNWRVAIGTLPDGLSLSLTGLISGTPTNTAIGGTLTFEVVDTTCESIESGNIAPIARLSTVSNTSIRTRHGWPAFGGNDLSVLYKTLTPSGSHVQKAYTAPLVQQTSGPSVGFLTYAGGLKNTYSGYSQINIYGNLISQHEKLVAASCTNQPFPDLNVALAVPGGIELALSTTVSRCVGYCWSQDPDSCSSCNSDENTWSGLGNYGTPKPTDYPYESVFDTAFFTNTATVLSYSGTKKEFYAFLDGTENYPKGFIDFVAPSFSAAWTRLVSIGTWSFTLSDPYTDAEAIASQVSYTGAGTVAENTPDYLSWSTSSIAHVSSRFTSVDFVITCTNLVAGRSYTVSYELWNTTTNTRAVVSTAFDASSDSHTVLGSVPIPSSGQKIKISNATIRFS